jgi:acyl-CoA thioester hydrolase
MIPVEQIALLPKHLTVTIPEAYLDIFGHMNIQYYMKLFNDSIFAMVAEIGMDTTYFLENQRGMYAMEQHIRYLAEVRVGETLTLYSRLFVYSEKRAHFMHFMVSETHSHLAATLEVLAIHVNRETRRSAPIPEVYRNVMDTRIQHENQLGWDVPRVLAWT